MAKLLQNLSRSLVSLINQNVNKKLISKPTAIASSTILSSVTSSNNLINNQQQIRCFKDKGVLKLRCSSCYFKKLDDRWWVLCGKHPRHKQREKVIDHRDKWIVTHLTRGGKPFQKKNEAYICNTSPPGAYGIFYLH